MIMEKVRNYVTENQINKKEIADKMHISEHKLERILNTPDNILSCITYGKLCFALGISADLFTE